MLFMPRFGHFPASKKWEYWPLLNFLLRDRHGLLHIFQIETRSRFWEGDELSAKERKERHFAVKRGEAFSE